jgi:hypothetical protein
LLLLAQSCSGARMQGEPEATGPAAAPQGLELWVDAQAAEGGDGSAARPLRRLEAALAGPEPHRLVHLAPGLYPGPFLALDGTELVGGSAAVLTAPAGVTVLEARGAVSLKRLLVQGGTLGLGSQGQLRLEDVHFSGQRVGAVAVAAGGSLFAERVVFEASVSGAVGLLVASEARAQLLGCSFEGPWQRGIEAHAPESLAVTKSHFRGAVTALHLRGGSAELSDITIAEGRGPGLYVGGGRLGLQRVQVNGHEYALLTGSGAVVEAEDFSSTRADRAGVAVVNSKAHFLRLTITSAGTFGGLQCVASEVSVDGLRVEDVAGVGVFMRSGSLRVDGAVVARTRDPDGSSAEGMQLRGGRATLSNLTVREASGACVMAAEGADVVLSQATLERCHTAGLVTESGAHLATSAVTVQSSDGPGAVATGDGALVLSGFRTVSTDGVVWAECASGAQVTASEVAGALPALPCIQVLSSAPPPLRLP